MIPADQSFEAADGVVGKIDDRLVVQLEFPGRQRPAQILLHNATGLHLQVHPRLEEPERAAAVALGPVEREVGVAQQFVGGQAIDGADRDTDAGADHRLMAVDIVGFADRVDDALRQTSCVGGVRRDLHDGEFVAAHPRDGVVLAHQPPQPVRDHLQQPVAAGMAQRVVHRLEPVEIEVVDRDHFVAMDTAERLFQPLVQQDPVGQIGEGVVVRHVLDANFGSPLLGDVLVGGDPATIRHRPMANFERAPVLELEETVAGDVRHRDIAAPFDVLIPRHFRDAAGFEAHVDDVIQRRAGADPFGRKPVHFDEAIVAYDQPVRGVEKTQALRHVVDGGVELRGCGFRKSSSLLHALPSSGAAASAARSVPRAR